MKSPVVVLDAGRGIGRAVVQAAVDARRPVIAVSPDEASLRHLKAACPGADLTFVIGSIADDSSSAALAAALRKLDRPLAGIVIAMCREPDRGRVLELSSELLRQSLNEELFPHLAGARALLPLLAEANRNGRYVVIGGPGGEQPWAGYGHRSISAAAARMLMRVLHDEARSLGVRVQLLAVEMPARTDDNGAHACPQWPGAIDIGERALALIDHTDRREPAGAVVRYAWHAVLPLPYGPTSRTRKARGTASSASAVSTGSVADGYRRNAPNDAAPLRDLDDTWALLAPLLSSNHKKASTP